MFGFFFNKSLISANQTVFKPGESSIYQLSSITHNIYKSFNDGYKVRDALLDISKAFGTRDLYSNYKKKGYQVTY